MEQAASLGAQGQKKKVQEVISKIPRTAAHETFPGFTNVSVLCPLVSPLIPIPVALAPHPLKLLLKEKKRGKGEGTGICGKAWLGWQESCLKEEGQAT